MPQPQGGGARRALDVLAERPEACGMQLNLFKTGIAASSAKALAAARRAFAGSWVPVLASARDLGVDVCWGRRRPRARKQRVGKAHRQADRMARLLAGTAFTVQVAARLLVAA